LRERIKLSLFYNWIANYEGPTCTAGLLRIFLAVVILARWAQYCRIDFDVDSLSIFVNFLFFIVVPCMLVGFYTKLSTFLTFCCLFLLYYVIPFRPWFIDHHEYLIMISTFYLVFAPCHKSLSIDRYIQLLQAVKEKYQRQRNTPIFGH